MTDKALQNRLFDWQTPLDPQAQLPHPVEQADIFRITAGVLVDLSDRLAAFRVASLYPSANPNIRIPNIPVMDQSTGECYSVAINTTAREIGSIIFRKERDFVNFDQSIYYVEDRRTRRADSRFDMGPHNIKPVESNLTAYIADLAEAQALQAFSRRIAIMPGN